MMALIAVTKTEEIVVAVVAILLLVMATFGLDSKVFRKKRQAKRAMAPPKKRISFIVEDASKEPRRPTR
jgi:hypothetical protein